MLTRPLPTLLPRCSVCVCVQARLDRVFAKVRDWEGAHIELVGDKPIPGLTREVRVREAGSSKEIPVWISHHLGLYTVFSKSRKQPQQQAPQKRHWPGAA